MQPKQNNGSLYIELFNQNTMTKKIMNRLLLVFAMFASISAFAQGELKSADLNGTWTMIQEKDGVQVFLKQEKCDVGATKPLTYAFIKVQNTTTESKSVEFLFETHYADRCVGCGDEKEYIQTVNVKGNSSIEGNSTFERSELSLLINNPFQSEEDKLDFIKLIKLNITK